MREFCEHNKSYWTPQLTVLSNELRYLRKAFEYRSTDYNGHRLDDTKIRFSEELRVAHLNIVDPEKFWKKFKNTMKKRDASRRIGSVIDSETGRIVVDDKERCHLFHENICRSKASGWGEF